MNQFRKLLALGLCLCLMVGAVALAEGDAEPVAATEAAQMPAADAVIATANGTEVKWADAQPFYDSLVSEYGSYYDLADASNVQLFESVAMENAITMSLVQQAAVANGLDQFTEEELAAINAQADSVWQDAIDNYVAQNGNLTDASTDEEKAAANEAALKYYSDMGFNNEVLRQNYKENEVYSRVRALITKDVAVEDAEVETAYQEKVTADQALYENDASAYEEYNNYVSMMQQYAAYYGGSASDYEHAWYKPNGYRSVKHILLPVDETLMNTYTDLQARLEEQLSDENAETAAPETTDEPSTEPTAEPTAEPTPVTQADVDNAKAAILDSLAATIDEINQKLADGADFDALSAEYGVDADGNTTDPGTTSDTYKVSGYEVAQASSGYAPEFVEAAFSVDSIGDVSAPYLSKFGVHIVKYIGDVEGGPIAMTDDERAALKSTLLTTRQSEAMTAWQDTADVQYMGVIPSMDDLAAAQAETPVEATPEEVTEPAAAE